MNLSRVISGVLLPEISNELLLVDAVDTFKLDLRLFRGRLRPDDKDLAFLWCSFTPAMLLSADRDFLPEEEPMFAGMNTGVLRAPLFIPWGEF